MERSEFEALYNALKKSQSAGEAEENSAWSERLQTSGYLDGNGMITDAGRTALEPYKVDNAIIMAAGLGSRCLPISRVIPKGLLRVKGEVLIERQIRQLREAGIGQIVIVTGYLAEKYAYLKEKFNVILIHNPDYLVRNNTSSLFVAREYLGNSYICCTDTYFKNNLFESYVYDSYYTCKYAPEYVDEYCLTEVDEQGYIHQIKKGGTGWYTMGPVFFSRSFSLRFMELLTAEYEQEEVKGMLIDSFHIRHMDQLPSTYVPYRDDEIIEFDTIPELRAYDPEFEAFYSTTMKDHFFEQYKNISRYNGIVTDQVTGRLQYNENLWGPSPDCFKVLYETQPENLYLYDASEEDDLISALSAQYGVPEKNIYLHNSSSELIKSIFSIALTRGDNVLLPSPSWGYYEGIAKYKFFTPVYYGYLEEENRFSHDVEGILRAAEEHHPKLIVITSPANPTGNSISPEGLETIVCQNPGSLILVDEAYYGYRPDYELDLNYFISAYENVVFSRTFSKYYGLAGLRVGYAVTSEAAMQALWLDLPLYKISFLSRRLAAAAVKDSDYYRHVAEETMSIRHWFSSELGKLPGVTPFESHTNFVYAAFEGYDMKAVQAFLKDHSYLVRMNDGEKRQYLRVTLAPREILEDFLSKLTAALELYRLSERKM